MLLAMIITLFLVMFSVMIHYEMLRNISNALPNISIKPRARLLIIIAVVLIAHILQIGLFAIAYGLMQHQFGMGEIVGRLEGGWLDFFYFSASNFTTLGMGDILPTGHLRFVSAIESLAGLVLITWSASYTYLAMSKFWGLKKDKKPKSKK